MSMKKQLFNKENLAENLRTARESCGKSVKNASTLIGISTSRLKNYESGKYFPSLPELESLSFLYQIPITAFYSEGNIEKYIHSPNPEQLQRLIEIRQRIIGTRLQIAREELDFSLKKLSKETGITSSKIKKYESGLLPVPIDDLEAICEIMEMDIENFTDADSPIGKWQTAQTVFSAVSSLPEELVEFLSEQNNEKFITAAKRMSEIGIDNIQSLSTSLSRISKTVPDEEPHSDEG